MLAVTVVRTGSGCRTWLNSAEKPQPIRMAAKGPAQAAPGFNITAKELSDGREALRSVPSPIKKQDNEGGETTEKGVELRPMSGNKGPQGSDKDKETKL